MEIIVTKPSCSESIAKMLGEEENPAVEAVCKAFDEESAAMAKRLHKIGCWPSLVVFRRQQWEAAKRIIAAHQESLRAIEEAKPPCKTCDGEGDMNDGAGIYLCFACSGSGKADKP